MPRDLQKISTASGAGDGGVHLDCAGDGGKTAGRRNVHSRIERDSGQRQQVYGANGSCRSPWIQGMRAVLSKIAHRNHRHTDSKRFTTGRSTSCEEKPRTARRLEYSAGDGCKSARKLYHT